MTDNSKPKEHWMKSREISERIIIEGTLVLETPASLSNGDADGDTDISLLLDPFESRALLTGTSIAGALRNYLRERLLDYKQPEEDVYKNADQEIKVGLPDVTRLFGCLEDDGEQSHLIVDDALAHPPKGRDGKVLMKNAKPLLSPLTELRDGVRIDGKTRTAYVDEKGKGAKFDFELLEAGTEFLLRFELLITNYENAPSRKELINALTTALNGFETREIHLGGRKRRGYGQCCVNRWTVTCYDLQSSNGLLAWLSSALASFQSATSDKIDSAMKAACDLEEEIRTTDKRSHFKMTAQFALDSSLLIRSGSALLQGAQPDSVQLHSKRKGKAVPVVSGTSLAGVLRHRALRIANTIANDEQKAARLVEHMFGVDIEELKVRNRKRREENKKAGKSEPDEQPFASRLEVTEVEIEAVSPLVQTRVRIDRFTGGAYEGALFDAAPVFAQNREQKTIEISLMLRSSTASEIGLLLLLLKDLWTSDLPIGGELSIGRGRLWGLEATLEMQTHGENEWSVTFNENEQERIILVDPKPVDKVTHQFLNGFINELNNRLCRE